tara:strand:- start:358 stop:540 length:183 start_codon:yes stop_codon:yes gene_type:complete
LDSLLEWILYFAALRKGRWGSFTKKTMVALRPFFLFCTKANASIAFLVAGTGLEPVTFGL